jgi:hypothetical protein
MNLLHRWYCGSSRWATLVEGALLPWALEGMELGAELLELGRAPASPPRCCGARWRG